MEYNKTYYARVRYKGQNYGDSRFSAPISFTLRPPYPGKETGLIIPGDLYDPVRPVGFGNGAAVISKDRQWCVISRLSGSSPAVLIYKWMDYNHNWTFLQKIASPNGVGFGVSLAVTGNGGVIAVGCPTWGTSGKVYIYRKQDLNDPGSQWQLASDSDVLSNQMDATSGLEFGSRVRLSEDGAVLIVGVPGASSGQGAVQVFVPDTSGTYLPTNEITPIYNQTDGTHPLRFGEEIALSDDAKVLLIAAPGDSKDAAQGGRVYSYEGYIGSSGHYYVWRGDTGASISTPGQRLGTAIGLSGDGSLRVYGGLNRVMLEKNGVTDLLTYTDTASQSVWANVQPGSVVGVNYTGNVLVISLPATSVDVYQFLDATQAPNGDITPAVWKRQRSYLPHTPTENYASALALSSRGEDMVVLASNAPFPFVPGFDSIGVGYTYY